MRSDGIQWFDYLSNAYNTAWVCSNKMPRPVVKYRFTVFNRTWFYLSATTWTNTFGFECYGNTIQGAMTRCWSKSQQVPYTTTIKTSLINLTESAKQKENLKISLFPPVAKMCSEDNSVKPQGELDKIYEISIHVVEIMCWKRYFRLRFVSPQINDTALCCCFFFPARKQHNRCYV